MGLGKCHFQIAGVRKGWVGFQSRPPTHLLAATAGALLVLLRLSILKRDLTIVIVEYPSVTDHGNIGYPFVAQHFCRRCSLVGVYKEHGFENRNEVGRFSFRY